MPLVSSGFSPTARQNEPDGHLTAFRNPLDPMSCSECPVERSPDTGLRDAAAPEFTVEATFPTPMHWLAEAQATPLKVVIGVKSCAVAPAEVVMTRVGPVATPNRVSTNIKDPIRSARVQQLAIL
jgi:hypothetical protein